ncbi:hypothetical protein [Gloeobacter violaceus]|uniref:Glr3696 protein n=1 Tax=Gloeobacter violaceus (strain ATCC 29082 / PCC 7421) TaxID=251221 RepID=Q7NF31_GLOVI|nr:hypothetical protein [Gloeobacter violaceus]BAC91637.1 glr3696 [Gloeobacter violaceus PCC 7421]
MLLSILREVVADGLLAVVLSFLFWAMWQCPIELTALLVVTVIGALRLMRPVWVRLAGRMHLRFNQWVEWPIWRRVASVHEAGHLIVAHRLGVPVAGYALTPAASYLHQHCGATYFQHHPDPGDPKQLLRTLTVLVAGKVSEELVLGKSVGAGHDLRTLAQWAALIDAGLEAQGRSPVGAGFWQQACEAEARQLLKVDAPLIEQVADGMRRHVPVDALLAAVDRARQPATCA